MRTFIVLLMLLMPVVAHAAKGAVQQVPDQTGVLVQKDVGNERWSITLDFERATISGNVFRPSGDPAFVFCLTTGADESPDRDPRKTQFHFDCFGADRCIATPCLPDNEWSYLTPVTIPGSFFLP